VKPLPLHRFNEFVRLQRSEADAFAGLAVDRRNFHRHDVIRAQGEPSENIYFLVEGWVACCVDTANGAQQIVKVHLPGDMLGGASLALEEAAESLVALSPTAVDVIPSKRFGELLVSSPRIAAAMFLAVQQERIWLMDRLTSIGRTSAAQRLAAFLLSLHDRLKKINRGAGRTFDLPLSQSELAKVLGITTVHANRTLHHLGKTGMISRSGRMITLEDLDGLRDFCGVPQRQFNGMPAWLMDPLPKLPKTWSDNS
jgi:CRP-like cAMP-binding protein